MLLDSVGDALPTRSYVDDSEAASESVSSLTSDSVQPSGAQEDLTHASETRYHVADDFANVIRTEDVDEVQHGEKSEDIESKEVTMQPLMIAKDTANANEACLVATETSTTRGDHGQADSTEPDGVTDRVPLVSENCADASLPTNAPGDVTETSNAVGVECPSSDAQTAPIHATATAKTLSIVAADPEDAQATEATSDPRSTQPALSPLEQLLTDVQVQRSSLIAQFASNPTVAARMLCHKQAAVTTTHGATSEDGEAAMKVAKEVVKEHIELLHRYNEIRDVGQGLIGMIADQRGMRIKDVMEEFGMGERD